MSHLIRKSHNASILLYHFVCPAKYRRALIDKEADQALKEACLDIADRYQVEFFEIETDEDHVHFLAQSVPTYSPMKIIAMIKSLTAREVFTRAASVKKQLSAGEFWTDDYYVGTAGQPATEDLIRKYVQCQGQEEHYEQLHVQQLELFLRINTPSACGMVVH